MNIIQILPEHIANQIAAGEVIQRPSSVVKELLENSIDAGGGNINVNIVDAGKTLIQVIDDGCGMSEKDAEICFQRHATSKIQKANDLFEIKTMGFRGEALSSIGSISMVNIKTKLTEKETGIEINIQNGEINDKKECICKNGTSIKIKNLFYNIPARRKFLKSNSIEMRHISEEFIRIALANPHVNMNLSHNKKDLYHLKKSNFRKRIISIIGEKKNEMLVPIYENSSLVNISGFIGKPDVARRTRGEQYFFVNKRFIKNNYLNHAIQKGFSELIPEKYFPSYFIHLTIDPKTIDINIHPTKTEIQFENEKAIYAIIISSIRKSLGEYNIAPSIDFSQELSFNTYYDNKKEINIKEPKINIDKKYNPFNYNSSEQKKILHEEKIITNELTTNKVTSEFIQFKNKYIIFSDNQKIILIHQRRAHRRILYEYFFENLTKKKPHAQQLLYSKELFFNKEEMNLIKEMKNKLISIGFSLDIINKENKILITGIPHEFLKKDIKKILDYIIELFKEENKIEEEINKKLAISLTKELIIKNNHKMKKEEMSSLVSRLFSCKTPYSCPLGKRIIMNINDYKIETQF